MVLNSQAAREWALLLTIYPVVTRAPCFPAAYLMSHHPFATIMHLSQNLSCLPRFCQDKIQESLPLYPAAFVTSSCERLQTVGEWLLFLRTSPAGQMGSFIGLSVTNNSQAQKEQWYCQGCRWWRKIPCLIHMMNRREQGMCQHAIWKEECVHENVMHM